MSLSIQHIHALFSNIKELSSLFNVNEEQQWLKQFIAENELKYLLDMESSNFKRLEFLCKRMVTQNNDRFYTKLIHHLMEKEQRYKSLRTSLEASNHEDCEEIHCETSFSIELLKLEADIGMLEAELQKIQEIPFKSSNSSDFPVSFSNPYTSEMIEEREMWMIKWNKLLPSLCSEEGVYHIDYSKLSEHTMWRKRWQCILSGDCDQALYFNLMLPRQLGGFVVVGCLNRKQFNQLKVEGWYHPSSPDTLMSMPLKLTIQIQIPTKKERIWFVLEESGICQVTREFHVWFNFASVDWSSLHPSTTPIISLHLVKQ